MIETTCPSRDELLEYLVGRLTDQTSQALVEHVESCTSCQAMLATIDDADDTMAALLRRPVAGDPYLEESQCDVAVARAKSVAIRSHEHGRDEPGVGLSGELGDYRLIRRLGRGGMGTVYKALHTKLDRVVAVKVVPKSRLADDRAIARFQREMKAIGRLNHPNIVQAHDAREIDDMPVLIMEYVDGTDLAEVVRRLGPLRASDACELARQTALGLAYAHQHGLVHRDIKPSNIMLTRRGEVKLLDLGLARFYVGQAAGEEVTGTGQAMGTADYMAPEQVSDSREVDIRADVYSLGCTIYKLLAGHAPFSGPEYKGAFDKMTAHVGKAVPPIRDLVPDVPHELVAILDRMLAKDPEDRFARPAELAEVLEPSCAGADLPALAARAEEQKAAPADRSQDVLPPGGPPALPGTPQARPQAAGRRGVRIPVVVALVVLSFLAGFAFGVVIRITKAGKTTEIQVPDGSKVDIGPEGQVEVTLSEAAGTGVKQPAAALVPDEQAIQGTWRVLSALDSGREVPDDDLHFTFREGRYTVREEEDELQEAGRYTLDASTIPSRTIDFFRESTGEGKWLGIYELEGDRLRLCLNERGGRPTKFASDPESPSDLLIELRRVRDAETAVSYVPDPRKTAREAFLRTGSSSNLKQIGLALHMYHDTYKTFPPTVVRGPDGKTVHSWRVALLPFLNQTKLHDEYRFDEPWDSPHNRGLLNKIPLVYRSPAAPPDSTNSSVFALVGPEAALSSEEGVPIREFRDGTSNTILAVEAERAIPWTKPDDIPYDPKKPVPELGGFYEGGFHVLFGDAAVQFLSKDLDEQSLRALMTKSGGERLPQY